MLWQTGDTVTLDALCSACGSQGRQNALQVRVEQAVLPTLPALCAGRAAAYSAEEGESTPFRYRGLERPVRASLGKPGRYPPTSLMHSVATSMATALSSSLTNLVAPSGLSEPSSPICGR